MITTIEINFATEQIEYYVGQKVLTCLEPCRGWPLNYPGEIKRLTLTSDGVFGTQTRMVMFYEVYIQAKDTCVKRLYKELKPVLPHHLPYLK